MTWGWEEVASATWGWAEPATHVDDIPRSITVIQEAFHKLEPLVGFVSVMKGPHDYFLSDGLVDLIGNPVCIHYEMFVLYYSSKCLRMLDL
jgi:fumarate reductase subunit C